jgi:hypothetical protein
MTYIRFVLLSVNWACFVWRKCTQRFRSVLASYSTYSIFFGMFSWYRNTVKVLYATLLQFLHILFDVDLKAASTVNLCKNTEYNSALNSVYSNKITSYGYAYANEVIKFLARLQSVLKLRIWNEKIMLCISPSEPCSYLHTTSFGFQKCYAMNTLCVYVFCMNLRSNSSCCTVHH